jgi:hypothetical protein
LLGTLHRPKNTLRSAKRENADMTARRWDTIRETGGLACSERPIEAC